MHNHWVNSYIGLPWVSGARGPDCFDCYGLVYDVSRRHYNRELALYPGVDAKDRDLSFRLIRKGLTDDWAEIDSPTDGCLVVMSLRREPSHVGIWVNVDGGRILHAMEKANVLAQSLRAVKSSGITRISFYDYVLSTGSSHH